MRFQIIRFIANTRRIVLEMKLSLQRHLSTSFSFSFSGSRLSYEPLRRIKEAICLVEIYLAKSGDVSRWLHSAEPIKSRK